MTKEDRARIARENGAKSRGPITPEGKAQSRMNSIKTGEHAETLAQFVPPNSGILCHEDRKKFYALIHQLTQIYLPATHARIARAILFSPAHGSQVLASGFCMCSIITRLPA